FVLKLDANGNFLWVKRMGGASSYDRGTSITTDIAGNVYTTGHFQGTADFNPETGTHNITSAGFTDIFIHKMSPCFITGADVLTACDNYTWIDGNTYTASNNTASFNIVGGAVNGCDSLVTLDLTINSLPTVSTTTSGTTITVDQANATYQWLDCDNGNAPISGETGQSFTATQNGNYAVIVDNGNCSATSACVTIATVGLDENVGLTKQIEVYPNPTTENLTLNLGSIAMGTIEIYN